MFLVFWNLGSCWRGLLVKDLSTSYAPMGFLQFFYSIYIYFFVLSGVESWILCLLMGKFLDLFVRVE